ncbi:large ribosomal subunit protein P1-like [Lytechinus pictus]|uniref:large ribosomal subunit protein P1-like n=1 Tax=Lytechinus pictus TaxID=7653 RepID=UPI00240D9451|nr:60S acidic ribosomal protein P1-like [Lytechinus pictus]
MSSEDNTSELACVYSALILQDDEVPITADKLQTLIKAAGVNVEPYWCSLFAKALSSVDLSTLIANVGAGGGGGGAAAAPAGDAGGEAPAEEKKEEVKEESEESDDDMGFGLFD